MQFGGFLFSQYENPLTLANLRREWCEPITSSSFQSRILFKWSANNATPSRSNKPNSQSDHVGQTGGGQHA